VLQWYDLDISRACGGYTGIPPCNMHTVYVYGIPYREGWYLAVGPGADLVAIPVVVVRAIDGERIQHGAMLSIPQRGGGASPPPSSSAAHRGGPSLQRQPHRLEVGDTGGTARGGSKGGALAVFDRFDRLDGHEAHGGHRGGRLDVHGVAALATKLGCALGASELEQVPGHPCDWLALVPVRGIPPVLYCTVLYCTVQGGPGIMFGAVLMWQFLRS
jgi:hypothetical protein